MRIALFCHSLRSDWNHGNAHFLRGIVRELVARGHDVLAFEPRDGWSAANLVADHGPEALDRYAEFYPALPIRVYDPAAFDLDAALDGVTLVLVHEWNPPALVARIGRWRRAAAGRRALFHDTHHRSVSAPDEMRQYDLGDYDGVLAFGDRVREEYRRQGWARQAWTWHEAADVALFQPRPRRVECDLVWVGNWGDDERTAELEEYLIEPVRRLSLRARVFGVRYPPAALERLRAAHLDYRGWAPNYVVPDIFSRAALTIHIPRRPYRRLLPGIPTIRPFEALACGVPLVTAPWEDVEGLFRPGVDYLVAQSRAEMADHLRLLLHDRATAAALAASGRETVLARHTCAHRVDELLAIAERLGVSVTRDAMTPARADRAITDAAAIEERAS